MFRHLLMIATLGGLLLTAGCQGDEDIDTDSSAALSNETFWQLIDDSQLTVRISPWPPQANSPATIVAEASLGDWGESVITEQVFYGFTTSESESVIDWQPLTLESESPDLKQFGAEAALPSGTIYLHFDARAPIFAQEAADRGDTFALYPWEIVVK